MSQARRVHGLWCWLPDRPAAWSCCGRSGSRPIWLIRRILTRLPGALKRRWPTPAAWHATQLAAIAPNHPGAWVLAADTVVACGRRILPKAETEAQARQCLELLSGRRHRVLGGIALAAPDGRIADRVVVTSVAVKRLSRAEIAGYIASGDWHGKAGG